MKDAKYKDGQTVNYTNPQGVDLGTRTVLSSEIWKYEFGKRVMAEPEWRYFISDSDTPWFPVSESSLTAK